MTEFSQWFYCFVAGAAIGGAYLGLLWRASRVLARGQWLGVFLALAALRGALILAALALAISLDIGTGGILSGVAGFTVLRLAVTRRVNSQVAEATLGDSRLGDSHRDEGS